jgi:hypothetical protein
VTQGDIAPIRPAGLAHLEPDERIERMQAAIRQALGALSMTQCPYFEHQGVCDRGCHQEPVCVTDQPSGGWAAAAIEELEGVYAQPQEEWDA